MRGVPLLMTSRMTSSRPPPELCDSSGPYIGLVICGLVWQTRQDWLNNRMPSSCLSSRLPAAGWASAAPESGTSHATSNDGMIQALRRIGRPPVAVFCQPTTARRRREAGADRLRDRGIGLSLRAANAYHAAQDHRGGC